MGYFADKLTKIFTNILSGKAIGQDEAFYLTRKETDLWGVLYGANLIRQQFKGSNVNLCSIINAKSGNCSEDCRFCAQSGHHSTEIDSYPLVSHEEITKSYGLARQNGAHHLGIVTSGDVLAEEEINSICQTVKELSHNNSSPALCASLGRLSLQQSEKLKQAGFIQCHHNLETSRTFFPQVCTTHSYDDRIQTIQNLQKAGLKVCSGGIFGLGETWADRIEMAWALKELDVDSIPLNFLIPIKGTALGDLTSLAPFEALRIIALFRYILPEKNIRVCAGREKILRALQSWIFCAGANGIMIGGYLTQSGRSVKEDTQMLKDLGLTYIIDDKTT